MTYRLSLKMLEELGTKIRKARESGKRKAIDVAVEAGIEPSYYTKIEYGKAKRPSLQKIYAICRALNLEAKDILPF